MPIKTTLEQLEEVQAAITAIVTGVSRIMIIPPPSWLEDFIGVSP